MTVAARARAKDSRANKVAKASAPRRCSTGNQDL
jgi:hypothetical protein